MKYVKLIYLSIILICLVFNNCARQSDSFFSSSTYLGQKVPGEKPEIFAPGIVSTELEEFGCSFTPDGREFYFTRTIPETKQQKRKMTIMVSRLEKWGWTQPEPAAFSSRFNEGEPNFSPAGDMVIYGRLVNLDDGSLEPKLMISKRKEEGWSEPQDLMQGMFASITYDSVIYYTDVKQGHSKGDLYKVKFIEGTTGQPVKLSGALNTEQQDAHPFVTPDGSMLLFDSNRPGGFGDNDLYISFRLKNGSWSSPINMGATVNSKEYDALPYLTNDGRYLFFSRGGDIYWVDSKIIERLKSEELGTASGSDLHI